MRLAGTCKDCIGCEECDLSVSNCRSCAASQIFHMNYTTNVGICNNDDTCLETETL